MTTRSVSRMKQELLCLLESLTEREIEYLYEFAKKLFGDV